MHKLIDTIAETILTQAVYAELHASNMYKHLSNQCQRLGLFGAAKYFKQESVDEIDHYQLLADYFNSRGSVASIPDIDAIDTPVKSLSDALEASLAAENELADKYAKWYMSLVTKDAITAQFLLQFIEIQRNAVGEYMDWIQRLALAGKEGAGVLIVDSEMGA